ncbi:hypothetical protein AMJ85_11760 [candidate division BRC1 bacterium SM23_51]|nr:MAG: hypothetical protein AMJ85_11760 [candidate division BRC1 bacterium SM23_51]
MTLEQIEEILRDMPEAPWIRDMRTHYAKTGAYRPQDLLRLLGDPKEGVTMGPKESLSQHFQE